LALLVTGMHLSESHLEAGTTEPADVAPNEPPIGVRWLREKPAPKTTEHGQPLPTYIGVRAKRNDFTYSYRFDVAIPLVNEATDSVKGSKAKIVKVSRGGFIASGVLPEQLAIPPIHDIRVYIAPRSIALEFTSR
jgi:hypothetical protein